MQVVCINNALAAVDGTELRQRLARSIHVDNLTDLTVGREYAVQALENMDSGIWFYLHTASANVYPFPYPAEFFELRDCALPSRWTISLERHQGNFVWKRIAFAAWANDNDFYERLVAGDTGALSLYRRQMIGVEGQDCGT